MLDADLFHESFSLQCGVVLDEGHQLQHPGLSLGTEGPAKSICTADRHQSCKSSYLLPLRYGLEFRCLVRPLKMMPSSSGCLGII